MKEQLVKHIEELEVQYGHGKWFSFNHVAELYLYEFYGKDSEYQVANDPMNRFYLELGRQYVEEEDIENAINAYQKAIAWNPVDLDARFAKIDIEKGMGELELVRTETLELYPYLCTRSTMARFYRNLGFYYVEKYQPKLAAMIYQYSNLFFATEHADKEIAYLEKALEKKVPEWDVHELQAELARNQIPVAAPSQTLGLLYEVGKNEEQRGHITEAADCYMMVYDLTQDEEVKERLGKMTN